MWERDIFACTLFGKVPNNNSFRQVSWLVTIVSVLLISCRFLPVWNNGYAEDTMLLLLTVARQPVIFTRFPIKQAEKEISVHRNNYL